MQSGSSSLPGGRMRSKSMLLTVLFHVLAASWATAQTVTITSPLDQSTVTSPVRVQATATSAYKIRLMQVYLDATKVYEVKASVLDTSLAASIGSHQLTVRARDFRNRWFESSVSITVAAPVAALAITTTSLPNAVVGT